LNVSRGVWASLAALVLALGALNAILARAVDTCTGGSADSLIGGALTAILNLLGFLMLVRGTKPWLLALLVALPTLAALSYTAFALEFWHSYVTRGISACEAKTGEPDWALSGEEPQLIFYWVAAAAIYWIGLAYAAWRSFKTKDLDLDLAEPN